MQDNPFAKYASPAPAGGPVYGPGPKQPTELQLSAERRAEEAAARAAAAEARANSAEARAQETFENSKKGRPLSQSDYDKAKGELSQYTTLKTALETFKDDYAGNLAGGLENTAQAYLDVGTPGQRDWWAQFKAADNQIRNDLFGSALTAPEKAAYEATTVSPGMDPKQVKINLAKRAEIVRQAVARRKDFYVSNGFRQDAVDAIFQGIDLSTPISAEGQQSTNSELAGSTPAAAGERPDDIPPDAQEVVRDSSGNVVGYIGADGEFVTTFRTKERQAYDERVKQAAQGEGGYTERADQGITLGLSDEFAGVGGAFGSMLRGESPVEGYQFARDVQRQRNENADQRTGLTGDAVEIGSSLFLPLGAARTPMQAARVGAIAGGTGGFGYGEGAQNSLANATLGAGAGAALGSGLTYGGNALMNRQAARQISGNTANALSPSQIVQEGKDWGVRVMTTDVRPPQTRLGKLGRNIGDSIPFAGTAGPRAAQQVERIEAAQKLMQEFGADDTAIAAVSKDLIKTRGAKIGRLTEAKNSVISGIPGAVPAPKAIAEIDKQIAKLKGIDETAFNPVIQRLEGFKTALQSGKTLEQVEGQRRLLGDLFSDASLASIKGDGQKAINAIYNPLREDMGAFIEASGGPAAKAKWADANKQLAAMAGELDASAFKNLLNNAETTPESAAKIIFGKTPSDMRRLYGSLSEEGRSKVRSAIMFQAAEKSTVNDVISPQKFASAMEAMSDATGVFFSPADKVRIDGLTRLLKATQHASDAAANPMTGAQNTPLIAGVTLGQVFGTAALPATGAVGLLARAYESAPVRNALLLLGRTKPGSPKERAMLTKAVAALAASNDNQAAVQQFFAQAPGLSRAAAAEGDNVGEERPIQPQR